MAFGDPSTSFFGFVDGLSGTPLVCFLRLKGEGPTVTFEILNPGGDVMGLDVPTHGHWAPESGLLVIDGEVSANVSEVQKTGPYLVIERNGSGSIEADGSRHLREGEILVTASFLEQCRPGDRMTILNSHVDDVDDSSRDDPETIASGLEGWGAL